MPCSLIQDKVYIYYNNLDFKPFFLIQKPFLLNFRRYDSGGETKKKNYTLEPFLEVIADWTLEASALFCGKIGPHR